MHARPGRPLAGLAETPPSPRGASAGAALAGLGADAPQRLAAAVVLLVPDAAAGPGDDVLTGHVRAGLTHAGVGTLEITGGRSGTASPDRVDVVVDLAPGPDLLLAQRAAALSRPVVWALVQGWSLRVAVAWPPWGPCRPCALADVGTVVADPAPAVVREAAAALVVSQTLTVLTGVGQAVLGRVLHLNLHEGSAATEPVLPAPGCPRCHPEDPASAAAASETVAPRDVNARPDPEEVAALVGRLVRRIPPGHVMSYGDIARVTGVGSARQVGQVMAAGASGTPWWRVVRVDGGLPERLADEARRHWEQEGTPRHHDGVDMPLARWSPGDVGPT